MLIQRNKVTSIALDQATTFQLTPCCEYFVTIGDLGSGAATVQMYDGTSWLTYADSDGSGSQGFVIISPPSGTIRVNVTAGDIEFAARPLAPTIIKNE